MNGKLLYTGLVSLVVALGGFLMGFDAGVISGANPIYKDYFFLSDWALGWSVGCLTFGAMLGNAIAGPLADRFGRRSVLSLAALFYSVSAVSSALATDFNFFVVARMLGGVAVGLALLIAPVYIAEIAPPKSRGRFVSFNQLNIVIGFSAVFFSNYYILKVADAELVESLTKASSWRWMLGAETLPAVLYFLCLFFVPRSPRWLAQHGRDEEAQQVLNKFLEPAEAAASFAEIKQSVDAADQEQPTLGELFSRRMSYVLFIALGLGFFQQITGINAIFFYAPTIFEKTGIPQENAFLQTVILGLVNLGFTVLALVMIDRLGRRPLLLVGTSMMAACLIINAWAFQSARFQLNEAATAKIPTAAAQALGSLVGQQFDSERSFVAGVAEPLETAVRGTADFEGELPESLRTAYAGLAVADFGSAAAFQAAMETAVGRDAFVRELPVTGRNALRALKKQSFNSQADFVAAINSFNDQMTIDNYQKSLVSQSMNINARLVLLAIIGYIAAFAISLGPVMWAMFSEIFPNRLRGLAISLVGFFNSLVSYTVQQVFPWELSNLGPAMTFLIFGVFAALAFFFTVLFIPETKGKTLEQLEETLVRTH